MNIKPGNKVRVKSVEELEALSYLWHPIVLSDTHRRQAGEAVNVVLVDSSDDTFKDDNGYWWMCNMVEEVNDNRTLQIKINEPYQIKMVQRKAFYEGYSWERDGKEFIDDSCVEINYLYLNHVDNNITQNDRYIKGDDYKNDAYKDVDVSEYLTDITKEYALMETQRVWKEIADKGGDYKLLSKGVDEYLANCPCCQITPDDVPISQESDTCLQYCPMVDVWPDGCEAHNALYQVWVTCKTAENATAISIAAGEQLEKLRSLKLSTKKEEETKSTNSIKLKVGDKVRIKKLVYGREYGHLQESPHVIKMSGKICAVSEVSSTSFKLEECKANMLYSYAMIAEVIKEELIDMTGCHPTIAENIRRGIKMECYVSDDGTPTTYSQKRNVIAYGKEWRGDMKSVYITEGTYFIHAIPVDELDAKAETKKPKTETKVKSRDTIVRQLIADGYVLSGHNNHWTANRRPSFSSEMWESCGKYPETCYNWLPQWLEEVEVKE